MPDDKVLHAKDGTDGDVERVHESADVDGDERVPRLEGWW